MTSWLQIRLQNLLLASMAFLVIYTCSACQAAPTPSPLPSATIIPPTSTPTQTQQSPTATKAPTSTQHPTASVTLSPEPSATPEETGLSAEGPWLVFPDTTIDGLGYQRFGLVLVNQDGSGRAEILNAAYCGAHDSIIEHPANTMVEFGGHPYLVNPQLKKACIICGWFNDCIRYTGETQNLLASVSPVADSAIPELQIHKLPEGKLLASFPLMQDPVPAGIHNTNNVWSPPAWDTAGQNLAFSVITGSGSALNVYNTATGTAREIARFTGAINNIDWSPDGSNLILGVGNLFNQPFVESVQVVPLAGGSPRDLYALEHSPLHEVITWVDNHRFLSCEGSLLDVVMEGAYNLRLVDIRTAESTMLLKDGFIDLAMDRESQTVVVVNLIYSSSENQGYYLFPLADPKPMYIGELLGYQLDWDENLGLFITDALCRDDPAQIQAFDPRGKITCLSPKPESTPPPPPTQSPDGKWSLTLENGLWVEGQGQPRVKVLEETPMNIIWRPDSSGLFTVMHQGLEYISLPDLMVTSIVMTGMPFPPYGREIVYQWIGGE